MITESAEVPGFRRVYGTAQRLRGVTLVCFSTLLSVALVRLFLSVHYTWITLLTEVMHLPVERFVRLVVAALFAICTSLALSMLLNDKVQILGNGRMQAYLKEKARQVVPSGEQHPHFFVETRGLLTDIGWLFLYPDRLVFVGDARQCTIAPEEIALIISQRRRPVWLTVSLGAKSRALELLARGGDLGSFSENAPEARRLHQALTAWRG